MPDNPNKLSKFWQELKRRKVLRVITVYAAIAFVILQLLEILAPSLRLPEWTMNFVLVVLIVGFIIAVILSWIYDIHPEGRMVKTEPIDKVKTEDIPKSSNSWKIASYISFVVIVVLIVLHIIPRSGKSAQTEIQDKSIAVLPFKCLSNDPEKQYLADGTMDAILLHLSKIKDLRVMSRTSVEQYRKTDKTATVICQELDVAYLLEGSFQKYGDQARLIVQLIEPGKEGHVWADEYNRNWKDIFSVQSEVAQAVVSELHAVITPEEKQRIEKIPTTSLTAYDFYQRGRAEHEEYWGGSAGKEALERAEDLFNKALDYDSTFAQAYAGLAWLYRTKHYWDTFFSETYMDSVLILSDIALSFDDQLAEAYVYKGYYYRNRDLTDKAVEEFNKAIKFNPNSWEAFRAKGFLYMNDDLVKSIDNLQKAASRNRGPQLPSILRDIGRAYAQAGFTRKSNFYCQEALKLDGDSVRYYNRLADPEVYLGNYEKGIKFYERAQAIDSNNISSIYQLGRYYLVLGQYKESLKCYKKYIELSDAPGTGTHSRNHLIGLAYWKNGYKEEAEYYFNEQVNYCNRMNELGRVGAQMLMTYYYMAEIYAFRGEKDKAYENLRIFNQRERMTSWMASRIKSDPFFDSIRDESEFKQIVAEVEAKYQAEHERVRQWLEENVVINRLK